MIERAKQIGWLVIIPVVMVFAAFSAKAADAVRVSTLDWAPYTGQALPQYGATSRIVKKAFAAAETDVSFGFWPWKRAIQSAARGRNGSIAYFPGYHCKHSPKPKFIASDPIGMAPLGFAFRKSDGTPEWKDLSDLKEKRIGYVTGYAATEEFDALDKNGVLSVLRTTDDTRNLRKLVKGQVDIVLIDRMVFQYLVRTTDGLKQHVSKLGFAKKALETKTLYLCFRDDAKARAARETFNKGLKILAIDSLTKEYFATAFK